MGVVECISPPMCGSHRWIIHAGFTGGYHTVKQYTMFMGPLFRYLAMPLTFGTFSCV